MQGPLMGAATVAAPFKPAEIPVKMDRPTAQNGQMNNSSTRSSSPLERVAANGSPQDKDRATYLQQLIKDQKTCLNYPNVFHHVERLLADEIVKVRSVLFQNNTKPLELPTPTGKTVTLSKKVFVPAKDYPDYNFVGRILGPRGLTAKQLEQETGCKIMVRGKGSMRDKKKEEQNKGRPNWEHLNEELHVLITVEDSENRADVKLQRATQEIEKLLVPQSEGEDDLKKKQLMELAIINGTYRDNSNGKMAAANGMSRLSMPGLLQSTNPAFRMPNLMSQMMTPGLMNTSMLRPPISINSSMQNMEQPTLYYAPMDASQYSYAALNGLNGLMGASGLDYASANVSPNEMMGESGTGLPAGSNGHTLHSQSGSALGAMDLVHGRGHTHTHSHHVVANGN